MTTTPVTTYNPHQPGKSWVVLNDGDGTVNITLCMGFGKESNDGPHNLLSTFSSYRFDSSPSTDSHVLWDAEPVQEEK